MLVAADGVGSPIRRQYLPQLEVEDTGSLCIYGRTPLTEQTRPLVPTAIWNGFTAIVGGTAVILAKATVNGVGNYGIRMIAVDNGEPGSSDQLGLTTTAPNNTNVPALTFPLTTLRGGNIQVPQNPRN